ncbi:MAG: PP2C family protein-serine/threonine phosphatase, partial [Erysipelotrichaceae bacterium]|nr:PP2C family protein-serine/threonine phosphatase [Erysipelotrichaceae bacterium]
TYYQGVIGKYQTYLNDLLNLTLTEIDADDLEKCIETKTKSEKYEESQDYLNRLKENYYIKYIYIVKPLNTNDNDNMMDVMAGITRQEAIEDYEFYSVKLGNLSDENYTADVAAKYLAAMDSNETSYFSNRTEFGYDYTGIVPIKNSAGKPIATLACDISMNELQNVFNKYLLTLFCVGAFLALGTIAVAYRWLHNRIIDPISRLEKSSASFVTSNRTAENPEDLHFGDPDIHTGDEMESLSNSLTDMFLDMKNYMSSLVAVTKEKERIGSELSVATKIQADMLPRIFPAFPERKEFDLFASMDPAKEVGGDFYDFFMIDDNRIGLVIADVAGKGVPAALFMVISKTLLKNRALMGGSPSEIIDYVNDQLNEGNDADMFVTIWFAIFDISTGKGVAVNAGHEHPAIYRHETGKYELDIYRHSPICGTIPGMHFREHEFELKPGDRLFVYTDGLPEATNAQKELFGTDRMLESLNKDPEASVHELLAEMTESVDEFVGEADQFDDLTMLTFYYKGNNPEQ